ncbi:MAG: hypothetical protein P8P30_03240 [Rickettsiales bacterium]|nr:hypothetical protein [Rickettsiales bacterium]
MAKPVLTIANVEQEWIDQNRIAFGFDVIGLNCGPEPDVDVSLLEGGGNDKNGSGAGETIMEKGMLMSSSLEPRDQIRIYARCGTGRAIKVVTVGDRPA